MVTGYKLLSGLRVIASDKPPDILLLRKSEYILEENADATGLPIVCTIWRTVVIDLYSRQVVGWSMNTRMTATLVCDALSMALFRRGMPEGVIIHSDRGSQYCSKDYRDLIAAHNLKQSMSRKGNCWDNACVESFFHSMKVEAVQYEPIMTREEMRQALFEYIEVDYNRTRRHSALGYLSPVNFEKQYVA